MKIAIIIAGTKSYMETMSACVRRIQHALYHASSSRDILPVWVGVTCEEGEKRMREILPDTASVTPIGMEEGGEKYKNQGQILIANLQQIGFTKAVQEDVDYCWIVEPDILVPHNALSCMLDMLAFDDGYYDIAFVTYPSHSGGMFLGGNGSYSRPIEEDYTPEERDVPEDLMEQLETAEGEELQKVHEKIKECPPKGNVFEINAKKWRRRGWLDHAYPGIGKGAVLESDWTGLGCNLLTRKALALASFDGYNGGGTQDLFLNWRRWHAEGLKHCVITHTVCEHVVRDANGKLVHCFAHHEPQGECKGHLRVQHMPFYTFSGNDAYTEENDGVIAHKAESD